MYYLFLVTMDSYGPHVNTETWTGCSGDSGDILHTD